MRVILASASPARLNTLSSAGVCADVIVSGIDEEAITADTPAELTQKLAQAKGSAVLSTLPVPSEDTILIAADTLLEFHNRPVGKPHSADAAAVQWHAMVGQAGILHTGHFVARLLPQEHPTQARSIVRGAETKVWFASLSDAEIEAYAASGEPARVAGAFTIDGLGGPFISRIEGDHHNVVGLSLPLLRLMLADLGVNWTDLWSRA